MVDRSTPDIELLPCPFCGGGANLYQNEVDFHRKWSIGCGDCYADMDVCEDGRQEAAEIWNTRASQPATPTAMAQSSAGIGDAVAWRTKNDNGHWFTTSDKALADTWINIEKFDVEPLYAGAAQSARESALEKAALDFIDKVDRGEARSKNSYAAFKAALSMSSPHGDAP